MKKTLILFTLIISMFIITGCSNIQNDNEEKRLYTEKINYYVTVDREGNFEKCENSNNKIGKCIVGTYSIVSGNVYGNLKIEIIPSKQLINGEFRTIFDAMATTIEFTRKTEYSGRILEEKSSKEIYQIKIVDKFSEPIIYLD